MLIKYIRPLAFIIAVGLLPLGLAVAAPISLTEDEEAAMTQEPPLTQTDIDQFIQFGPELMAAGESEAEDAVDTVSAKIGWSRIRTAYIGSKIGLGYSLLKDPEGTMAIVEMGLILESYLPTDTERELIENNLDALDNMLNNR